MPADWMDTLKGDLESFFRNASPEELRASLQHANVDFYNTVEFQVSEECGEPIGAHFGGILHSSYQTNQISNGLVEYSVDLESQIIVQPSQMIYGDEDECRKIAA